MAKTLLIDAETQEEDPEIKTAIKRRIKDIDAKQDYTVAEQ
jgi:hypothetical protein